MTADERARTLHFAQRLFAQRRVVAVLGAALGLFCASSIGWITLLPMLGVAATFAGLIVLLPRSERPERALLAAFAAVQLLIVLVIALGDPGRQLALLCLLMLPASAACIVFPSRVMWATTAFTAALMVAVAFAVDGAAVQADPPALLLPLGVMITVTLPAAAVRRLELRSLSSATTDALTGALNRSALETRIVGLSQQAHELPLRIAVVMVDLDHFKKVNDQLGHDTGDRVLREVVHRIRAAVGPLTPVYRAGGEEFLLLLAGTVESEALKVGEQLRRAVAAAPIEGATVTLSCGVAAGTLDHYDVQTVIRAADEALYEAKRCGRDRVAVGNLAKMYVLGRADGEPADSVTDGRAARGEVLPLRNNHRTPAERSAAQAGSIGPKGNWLVRGEFEREHMRELVSSLNTTHRLALGAVFVALLISIPWMGWLVLMPAVVAVPIYHLAQRRVASFRRPEYVLGAAWLGVQIAIFLGAVIVEDPKPYMLILFVPMLVGLAAYFPTRGAEAGVAITLVLAVLAGVFSMPELVRSAPGVAAPFIAVIATIAFLSSVAGRASIEYRTQAVVDPLTGLLTRGALRTRLSELAGEDHVASGSVSVIAFDLDHFKVVNDGRGHAAGDTVLAQVGVAVRGELSALQWCFRLGGDEFVVVAPLATASAAALAERLRVAIGRAPVGTDLRVTASFGVASTAPGQWFDFDDVARRADTALYEAKHAGRDRVAVAAEDSAGPSPIARIVSGG